MNLINQAIPRWIPKTILFFLMLFAALFFTHINLVSNDLLQDYDDQIVVKPMANVITFSDYQVKLKSAEIYDRQPVRDLSFWIDYQFQKKIKLSIFHFHNLIIWFGITILFFYILIYEQISRLTSAFIVTLYAFHPCLTTAVSWVSARKHLLSTFFILSATLVFLKAFKTGKKDFQISSISILSISVLYFLSCFSQPINIMWPLWAFCFYFFNKKNPSRKRFVILFALLFGISLLAYFINNQYYSTTYLIQSGGASKYVSATENELSLKILSVGASFFQIICPIWPTPASYYAGDTRNIVGVILLVLFGYYLFKTSTKKKRNEIYGWAIFSILPLFVMNVRVTNILGSDTYILIPTLGVYILVARTIKPNRWHYLAFSVLILFFVFTSNQVSNSWKSRKELWEYAHKNNETPTILKGLAAVYLLEKQYDLSFQYAAKLLKWNSSQMPGSDVIYVNSLSHLANVSAAEKIRLLEEGLKMAPASAVIKYTLAINYAHQKKWDLALKHMRAISAEDFKVFEEKIGNVSAEFYYYCLKVNNMKNESCSFIPEKIKKINSKIWNETQYNIKLGELLK